jgi:uncharacterized integral membrane protein
MNIKTIIVILLLGLFIIVCIQNVGEVQIHFLFWSFPISQLLLLLIIILIGIFIGMTIPGLLTKTKKDQTKDQTNK